MSDSGESIKGRGSQINPASKYQALIDADETFLDVNQDHEKAEYRTSYTPVHPKSIINKVNSPDIGMAWSMNPYQGCEHGCVYCYARNTHPYWGFSAGLDFETRIMYKPNAPELLHKELSSRSWKGEPIMFSGNTDCYQPAERRFELTRQMLEVLWHHRQSACLLAKNSLMLRDMGLLRQMASENLVHVVIFINGTDEHIRRMLEPRTATYARRFETIKALAENGIPVMVMVAPVIPGLNDHQIIEVVEKAASAGARSAAHIVVRLNGDVGAIFEDWLGKNHPDGAAKIINRISALHGGKTNDSQFGRRMKGEGQFAEVISQQLKLARRKFMPGSSMPKLNTELFLEYREKQLRLF